MIFQLSVAIARFVGAFVPRTRYAHLALYSLLCIATARYCYDVLTEYEAFNGYPPFVAFFVVFAGILLLWVWSFDFREMTILRPWLRWFARWGMAACLLPASAFCHIINVTMYTDAYPTLHLCTLQVTYLMFHSGLSSLIFAIGWPILKKSVLHIGVFSILVMLVFVTTMVCAGNFCACVRPAFLRHTLLGRSDALFRLQSKAVHRKEWFELGGKIVVASDPRGSAHFRELGNMPKLPNNFRLDDYNILLISMEATRFDETTFADPSAETTPRLQDFADKGSYLFTRAHTASAYTVQTISSLFTMSIPSMANMEIRQKAWQGRLLDKAQTVPEILADAGYNTFWVGHSYSRLNSHGATQGFGNKTQIKSRHHDPIVDAKITDKAIAEIDAHAKSTKRFFGWIFMVSPHYPYLSHYPDMPDSNNRELYRQELRYGDFQIGRIIDHLDRIGIFDKTIVIFHGDHGEEFREHGGKQHNNVYNEVTHIPLVVYLPGIAGAVIDKPVSLTYLFPWLFLKGSSEIAKAAKKHLDEEIGPILKHTHGAVIVEMLRIEGSRSALVYPNHRIIYDFASEFYELYDLRDDPNEKTNIYDTNLEAKKLFGGRIQRYLQFRQAKKNAEFIQK
ncbi:MAG: sulfatase-like hydrolase/transferase [Proteobacteria bacterium]|nr:sulfatase-like hydrolase/transferase [Pseudomonadota bacterium]